MNVPDGVSDFENEMYVAVVEEASLWELSAGSTDLLPSGPVVHGPWAPSECAALITRWVERGWVELYLPDVPAGWSLTSADWQTRTEPRGDVRDWQTRTEPRGDVLVLTRADALDLLRDPHRWTTSSADGQASLSKTDVGMTLSVSEWFDQAAN